MQFRVELELLGPVLTDSLLQISFRPPIDFHSEETEFLDQARAEVAARGAPDDSFQVLPVRILSDSTRRSHVLLGRFVDPPAGGMSEAWTTSFVRHQREQVAPAEVREGYFTLERARVLQLLIQDDQYVNFRLVCQVPGRNPVQVDYLVPRSQYESAVRAIESSIGSMVFL